MNYGSVCSGIEAATVMRWIGERIQDVEALHA